MPGRPRSTAAHHAILRATIELIREIGYGAVGMEGIAARAGVGKTTLYRRWPSKEELVVEAVGAILRQIPVPDTGNTRDDVITTLRYTTRLYQDPATGALLAGLLDAMSRSEAIAEAVRASISEPRRKALSAVLRRGMRRGDLRRDLPVETAVDMLNGALLERSVVTGAAITDALATRLTDLLFDGALVSGDS
jgi:AcrR family transcriptional regulator